MILNNGYLGMVRQWQDVDGETKPPLPIALVDADVDRVTQDLHHRHPELRTLAAIGRLFHDEEMKSRLFSAVTADEMLHLLRRRSSRAVAA